MLQVLNSIKSGTLDLVKKKKNLTQFNPLLVFFSQFTQPSVMITNAPSTGGSSNASTAWFPDFGVPFHITGDAGNIKESFISMDLSKFSLGMTKVWIYNLLVLVCFPHLLNHKSHSHLIILCMFPL